MASRLLEDSRPRLRESWAPVPGQLGLHLKAGGGQGFREGAGPALSVLRGVELTPSEEEPSLADRAGDSPLRHTCLWVS